MFVFVILAVFACVSGQQLPAGAGKIQNKMGPPNILSDQGPTARQFHFTSTDQFVEQFKPNVGYTFSSPQQKIQFSHDNRLHMYLFQNKLSIYCATDTTYERITWRKYTCPGQIGNHAGEVIAVGPVVSNSHLYGVNSFGRNEEYVSELLLKQPLTPHTDGIYVCEGTFISETNPHEAQTTIRDIIIIGGKGMYQNCFAPIGNKL